MIYFVVLLKLQLVLSAISVQSSQNDSTLTFKHSRKIWKLHVFSNIFHMGLIF